MSLNKWEKNLALFDAAAAHCGFERKGKTMPYTSAQGHMFSLLNKSGDLGVRLSKEAGENFLIKYGTERFKSHGAFMRGYVTVPDDLLTNQAKLIELLQQAHEFVLSLEPK